jgi:hypothetical protein
VFDEDEDETESTEKRDPQKWAWTPFWSLFMAACAAQMTLWATFWVGVSDLMDSHHEWRTGREKFAERAALEIEALTKDPVNAVPEPRP